jgi:ATP-dependent Clp protease adaptor protein ClpS
MAQFEGFLPWRRFIDKEDGSSREPFNGGDDFGTFDDATAWGGKLCLRPFLYDVVIMDRKETPVNCIADILQKFFRKSVTESEALAKNIHHTGKAVCATYTREVAEMKIEEINRFSQEHHLVLQCMMEKGNKHAF